MDVIEWCRLHDIWYLKIDLEIPDVCISEAQAVYDEGFFVDHRYGMESFRKVEAYRKHSQFCSQGLGNTDLWMVHTKNPNGHGLWSTVKWGWMRLRNMHRIKTI